MRGGLFFCTTYIKKEIKFLIKVPLSLRKSAYAAAAKKNFKNKK